MRPSLIDCALFWKALAMLFMPGRVMCCTVLRCVLLCCVRLLRISHACHLVC